MRKPTNMMTIPQRGWHCRFPDGFEVTSNHPSDFLAQCFAHLQGNGGDTGSGWVERMWDLVCETHPEMECYDVDAPRRTIGPDDVRRFLTTIWETWKTGAQPVSEELQNQRIDTCLACPLIGYTSCFGGCSQLSQQLSEFTMGRTIPQVVAIHKRTCGACGCYVQAKTMFPLEVLKTIDEKMGLDPNGYHPSCWMRTES